MQLHYREFGVYREQQPTLILLHGLFGSASNWQTVARSLERRFHLLVPDLRNHGRSPHAEPMDYPSLANDVQQLIEERGLASTLLVGHSMGGKTAMWLAFRAPALVEGVVVVDIAPVTYLHEFDDIFRALKSVELGRLRDRAHAEATLAESLSDRALRQYLLQNLAKNEGGWYWRINLDLLITDISSITGFPLPDASAQYPGPTLFLYGGASDYVRPVYQRVIQQRFPLARLRSIPGAGHWLYAEKPEAFLSALNSFLDQFLESSPIE